MAISLSGIGAGTIVPASQKVTLAGNYVDFAAAATDQWGQQYMPDLMAKEAEIYGKRTLSGFLNKVGAEEAMASDQVIWTEQGRLHLSYTGKITTNGSDVNTPTKITLEKTIDGVAVSSSAHGVRVGDTVLVANADQVFKCYVPEVSGAVVTVAPYTGTYLHSMFTSAPTSTESLTLMVYGSEYTKGVTGRDNAVEPTVTSYSNKPIIIKDMYQVSGSDTAAIGWIEVSGEEGQSGYLWYLKAEGDTRARFTDYLEMTMLEAEKASTGKGVNSATANAGLGKDNVGSEGLFAAIESRGNVGSNLTAAGNFVLQDFDDILAEFDRQGAIEEYMMYLDRELALAMDDMLATLNAGYGGGTSYGIFNNSEDMALNLGFTGFRRGSYDFYKTDWKYLNDKATRGGQKLVDVKGCMIPAGVSSVYDETLGRNLKRPFLHVRYRASEMEDRRMKTWTEGSVGGNITSDLDAMKVHYLSERCLVTQGANNFMLLKV